jgi:hypothetical protein
MSSTQVLHPPSTVHAAPGADAMVTVTDLAAGSKKFTFEQNFLSKK